jgi:signal transduction histidine kinase
MISSLLDVNKFEHGAMKIEMEKLDLVKLLRNTLDYFYCNSKGVDIKFTSSLEEKICSIDSEKFVRVIENLVMNAITFSDKDEQVTISLEEADGKVLVKVIDHGPGVPEEHQEKIFQKFGQVETDQKGRNYSTGLGLTFCKYAVEAHGGQIGVENNPNKGSTFWFTISTIE